MNPNDLSNPNNLLSPLNPISPLNPNNQAAAQDASGGAYTGTSLDPLIIVAIIGVPLLIISALFVHVWLKDRI